jgi:membrane protease YdiL (CAAX protease family)
MKIIVYALFVLLFGFLLFRLPLLYQKKRLFQILGIGFACSFVLLIVGYFCFLIYAAKMSPNLMLYERQVINFFMGIISLFFFSLFILLFTEIIFENMLLGFHQQYNTANLDKNPEKICFRKPQ